MEATLQTEISRLETGFKPNPEENGEQRTSASPLDSQTGNPYFFSYTTPYWDGKSFDNFETKKGTEIHAIKEKILSCWDFKQNIIFLGNAGRGKTHLAVASMFLFIKKWKQAAKNDENVQTFDPDKIVFVKERKIYSEFLNVYGKKSRDTEENIVHRYAYLPKLLIIDDLFSTKENEFARSKMLDIIDERMDWHRKTTIITSNKTMDEIGEIDERIASRLQGNFTFQINGGEDWRTKL